MYSLGRALAMTVAPATLDGSMTTTSTSISSSTSKGSVNLREGSDLALPVDHTPLMSPSFKTKKKKGFLSVWKGRLGDHPSNTVHNNGDLPGIPPHIPGGFGSGSETMEEEAESVDSLPPPWLLNKKPGERTSSLKTQRSYLPQISLAIQQESLYSDGAEAPPQTSKSPHSSAADQQGFLIHPALFSSTSPREMSSPTNRSTTTSSPSDAEPTEDEYRSTRRRRADNRSSFARLQAMVELNGTSLDPSSSTSALPGIDSELAKRMEELGRARRLESTKKLEEHSKASSETSSRDAKPNPFDRMVLDEKMAPLEEVKEEVEVVVEEVTLMNVSVKGISVKDVSMEETPVKEMPVEETSMKETSILEETQTKPIQEEEPKLKVDILEPEEEPEMVGAFPITVQDVEAEIKLSIVEEEKPVVLDEEAELQNLVDTIKLAVERMSPRTPKEEVKPVIPEVEETEPQELTVNLEQDVVEMIEVKEPEKPVPPPPIEPPSPPPITPPKDILISPSHFPQQFQRSSSETPFFTNRVEELEWQLEQQKKTTLAMQVEKARREEQLGYQMRVAKDMRMKQANLEGQLEQHKKALRDMQIEQAKREQAAQAMLEKMRKELHASKMDNARLATVNGQHEREMQYLKSAQLENHELGTQLRDSKEKEKQLANDLSKAQISIRDLQKEKLHLEKDVVDMNARLNKGKEKQHEQLDVMHHKLAKAERQIRTLDNLTRFKLQARQEGIFGSPRRKQAFQSNPSSEVINAVIALNDEVLQAALLLVENLDKTIVNTAKHARCKAVLGNRLTGMLDAVAKDNTNKFSLLLMQVVLEVFLVHWCVDIIEAHYPKQESFSDLLIEMSLNPNASGKVYSPQAICGKQVQIIPTQAKGPTSPQLSNWVRDVFKELEQLLAVAGIRMRPNRVDLFSAKLLHLIKTAYGLRTALAEKDNLGGLELKVVSPDMPFQAKFMEDAHPDEDPRKGGVGKVQLLDFVVGTTGLGLQRDLVGKADGSSIEVVLKPKVVLVRVLREIT